MSVNYIPYEIFYEGAHCICIMFDVFSPLTTGIFMLFYHVIYHEKNPKILNTVIPNI